VCQKAQDPWSMSSQPYGSHPTCKQWIDR
jgi:hypothetical protein